MHVMLVHMRTTIEMTDAQRAKLLELAAERQMKGFSKLVQEVIDLYLESNAARRAEIERALATAGSLSEEEADGLQASVTCAREQWR